MKKLTATCRGALRTNQQGFIPMMLCILGVIALIIYLVYKRVATAGG